MEAKESLVNIIKALQEIGQPISRAILIDFLTGKETREITELGLDDKETYGVGDAHDDDYWTSVVDKAYESGYLKTKPAKSENLVPSPDGKRFAKKPTSFIIEDEDEGPSDTPGNMQDLDGLLPMPLEENLESRASSRTKHQIKIIHAVDRHIALDDLAESESMALEEVLDELEALIRQGRKMDITYFTNEVLGPECVEELIDFFKTMKKFSMEKALQEFGDVYQELEIRLAYIVYEVSKMK